MPQTDYKQPSTINYAVNGLGLERVIKWVYNYCVLKNTLKLNTTNTTALIPESSENISGLINLHKIAKTGTYDDLIDKPTIPAAITESTVSSWGFTKNTGTYSKPSTGIPKTDLASAIQTSLEKADTALQSFTESDPTVPSHVKSITTTDISNWNSKVSNVQADWNATSGDAVILNKPTIPTKTSQLTNDSNFLTEDDVQRFFIGTQTISENQDIAGAKDGDIYIKTT